MKGTLAVARHKVTTLYSTSQEKKLVISASEPLAFDAGNNAVFTVSCIPVFLLFNGSNERKTSEALW